MKKKLTKSRNNVVVSGVLGGISEFIGIDPTIIRVVYIILSLFTAGFPGFMLYITLMIIMPSDRSNANGYNGPYNQNQQNRDRYQSYHGYGKEQKATKRKEAEKVSDDDWSDF